MDDPMCRCAHRHHSATKCRSRACGCRQLRLPDPVAIEVAQGVAWERTADAADRGAS